MLPGTSSSTLEHATIWYGWQGAAGLSRQAWGIASRFTWSSLGVIRSAEPAGDMTPQGAF